MEGLSATILVFYSEIMVYNLDSSDSPVAINSVHNPCIVNANAITNIITAVKSERARESYSEHASASTVSPCCCNSFINLKSD